MFLALLPLASAQSAPTVSLSGYGEGWAVHDADGTTLRLRRFVLSPAATLGDRVGVNAEIEIEDAQEIELEQGYVSARVTGWMDVRAGIVLLPLGYVNQHHEPPSFDGVDRPLLDRTLLPSTWRELGALATVTSPWGLSVTGGAVTGANAAGLRPWTLAGARGQGLPSNAADMAGVGRVELTRIPGVGIGVGAYYGGASGGDATLGGVRLGVGEVDGKVDAGGLDVRVELAGYTVSDAARVTEAVRAAAPATDAIGSVGYGASLSASYDVLRPFVDTDQQVRVFARYELLNPRASVPDDVADSGASYSGHYLTAGVGWFPLPQLALKVDYAHLLAGTALPGEGDKLSAGFGFAF
jgi:hypothetical protein